MKSFNVPSIDIILNSFKKTFKRFPQVMLLGWFTLFYMIYLNHQAYSISDQQWRILACLMLGLPLMFGVNLFAIKKYSNDIKKRIGCTLVGILSIALFYFALIDSAQGVFLIKYIIFNFAAHLFASVCYFYELNQGKGFWQFNRILFIRFLLSSLYTGVLYLGISLILATIHFLFDIKIGGEFFLDAFYICICVVHVAHFLSGIPENLQELNHSNEYPLGLKAFAQYLLIPLITVYIIILYIYEAKILFTWTLPNGNISFMIIMMSVLGILNLLLIHPISKDSENKWMNTYGRLFYAALIPLLALLYISIIKRIGDYGVTESRYYVFLIAIWITGICLYFILNKKKDIRIIPSSLLICSLLSTIGPWSASQISMKSQFNRIEEFLIEKNILIDGVIQSTSAELKAVDLLSYKSSIRYIVKNFGAEIFTNWKHANGKKINSHFDAKEIYTFLGISNPTPQAKVITYENKNGDNEKEKPTYNTYTTYTIDDKYSAHIIKGYEYLVKFSSYNLKPKKIFKEKYVIVNIDKSGQKISFDISDLKKFEIDIPQIIKKIKSKQTKGNHQVTSIPAADLSVLHENEDYKIKIIFETIAGYEKKNIFKASYFQALILISLK